MNMREEKKRLALAERIAVEWNKNHLSYSVVHGLYWYPRKIGRDLDIVTLPSEVPKLVNIAIDVAKKCSFPYVLFRYSYWGLYQLVLVDNKMMISLPLDFLCTTDVWRAKLVSFLDEKMLMEVAKGDSWVGPFRFSKSGHFYKVAIRSLLCGDLTKLYKEYSLPVKIPEGVNTKYVERRIGKMGLNILFSNKVDMKDKCSAIARKLQLYWCLNHPIRSIKNLVMAYKGKLTRRIFNQPLIILVVCKNDQRESYCWKKLKMLKNQLRHLFIDLRIKPLKRISWVERFSHPPVSEFIVVLIISRYDVSPLWTRLLGIADKIYDNEITNINRVKGLIIEKLAMRV